MALPKRRHSHSRTAKKLTHKKMTIPALVECSQCHKLKRTHLVCPFCGYYGGKEIVKVEFKKKEKKKPQ